MRNLPFTVDAEALALIEEVYRKVEAETPELTNRVRVLSFAFSYTGYAPTPEGPSQISSHYAEGHFRLGWHKKEVAEQPTYSEWELGGVKVVIHKDTLERLKGRTLVVATVEVGYPNPANKTCRLLKAV
jgi:hypothetical protein